MEADGGSGGGGGSGCGDGDSGMGGGSGFSDLVLDYDDFLRYFNSCNWNELLSAMDRDRFLTLLRNNPALWLNWTWAVDWMTPPPSITNLSSNTNSSTVDTFWEAGKVRIPLYRSIPLISHSYLHSIY